MFLEPPASLCTLAPVNLTPVSCSYSHTFLNCFWDKAVPLPTLIFSKMYLCFWVAFCALPPMHAKNLGFMVYATPTSGLLSARGCCLSGLCCTKPIRLHLTIALRALDVFQGRDQRAQEISKTSLHHLSGLMDIYRAKEWRDNTQTSKYKSTPIRNEHASLQPPIKENKGRHWPLRISAL